MAYLTDMPGTCKARATNPEYALVLLDSIQQEFAKSFAGGIFDASYVLSKLSSLTRHVTWLEQEALKQFGIECEPEEDEGITNAKPEDLDGLPFRETEGGS